MKPSCTLFLASLFVAACGGGTAPAASPRPATPSAAVAPASVPSAARAAATRISSSPTRALQPATATPSVPAGARTGALQFVSIAGAPPGGSARATVQAAPGSQCSIVYTVPSGIRSTAAGLVAKPSDPSGMVMWSWVIGTSTRPGIGTVTVTCAGQTISAPITIR
jgi:hypothetical protein